MPAGQPLQLSSKVYASSDGQADSKPDVGDTNRATGQVSIWNSPLIANENNGVKESDRASISNESNVLLDPEVLPDLSTQALVLTVLATLVKYTTDEQEVRVLYQYLAEGSVVFPRVFPVMCVKRLSKK